MNGTTGVQVGTGRRVNVGPVTATTTYSVTATQSCSSETDMKTVTVQVPLPVTTSLQAAVAGNAIDVHWPPSAGAAQYRVERRSGPAWSVVATVTTPSYHDTAVTAGRTYAYRVAALDAWGESDSGYSNADVATIMSFTAITPEQDIHAGPFNEMLAGVNAVRAAVGWPAVTWADIIGPNQPLPQPGMEILSAHLASCRARMNEALQALGAPVLAHVPPDLRGELVSAAHIQQVQGQVY